MNEMHVALIQRAIKEKKKRFKITSLTLNYKRKKEKCTCLKLLIPQTACSIWILPYWESINILLCNSIGELNITHFLAILTLSILDCIHFYQNLYKIYLIET